jgi:signal transduction histidine kinase
VSSNTGYEARQTGRHVLFHGGSDAIVMGDAALIASAIENVVRNAVRYTPAGSSVDISLNTTRTSICIVVRDYGPGVPPGARSRVRGRRARLVDCRSGRKGSRWNQLSVS